MDFAVSADDRVKLKGGAKGEKYLNLAWEIKKSMEREGDGDANCSWGAWYSHQMFGKGTGELGNGRTSEDHQNCWIIKIG